MSKRLIAEPERVNPVQSVHVWKSPPGAAVDMVVVTPIDVYEAIHQHATAALPNETGGFLVGRVGQDTVAGGWVLELEEAMPVEPIAQNPTHFQFTWRDVDRVRTYRESSGKALLGWYHTHPDLGIFLSETDLDKTHRVLFSEPFQIALVYDPVRGRAGYFFWEGPQEIHTTPAGWREFALAVADPAHTGDTAFDRPPGQSIAQAVTAAGDTSSSAAQDGQGTPPREVDAPARPPRLEPDPPSAPSPQPGPMAPRPPRLEETRDGPAPARLSNTRIESLAGDSDTEATAPQTPVPVGTAIPAGAAPAAGGRLWALLTILFALGLGLGVGYVLFASR